MSLVSIIEAVKNNLRPKKIILTTDHDHFLNEQNSSISSCMHDQMLESNREDVKLEAMRCITVMIARGKTSAPRALFPHIVKNISSKNPELRKLIYLYLTSFADEEPDLTLLSVATLQKSLKSPNPLVRSSALKTLTSMRLNILSAILITTIQTSINDLSPYVRKTAAHSIIKLFRLEPSFSDQLIEMIERLLNDKNSIVISSAIASFEVVCSDRLNLLKKHYKRLCGILIDCNEWGQIVLVNLLKRFILDRHQLVKRGKERNISCADEDPKLLLRAAKPLVHSNNSAVVMAVIELYIAIANYNEVRSTIVKPLIRLLHLHKEIQMIVLKRIDKLTSLKEDCIEIVPVSKEGDNSYRKDEAEAGLLSAVESNIPILDEQSRDSLERSTIQNHLLNLKDTVLNLQKEGYDPIDGNFSDDIGSEEKSSFKDGYNPIESDVPDFDDNIDPKEYSAIEGNQGEARDEDENGLNENLNDEEEFEEYETEVEVTTSDDEENSNEQEETDESDLEQKPNPISSNPVKISKLSTIKVENVEPKFELSNVEINYSDIDSKKTNSDYRDMFRPHIKSFFIKNDDSTQVKLAKLQILTNLTSSINVTQVLRELQAYISIYMDDKEFVSGAIHSIGSCALNVKEVAHLCLNRLTSLLSNNNENIVSETIVVLRSQIMYKKPKVDKSAAKSTDAEQQGAENDKISLLDDSEGKSEFEDEDESNDKIVSTVIKQVTKLLPKVEAPRARATISWILAEFCGKNLTAARCAPEVLRSMTKSFCQQDAIVKLQTLTLASKLLISLDATEKPELYEKVQLLTNYLFSLAKYDVNHDVRDRGRFMRKLLCDQPIARQVLLGVPDVGPCSSGSLVDKISEERLKA